MKKIASVNEGQMTKHMRTLERLESSNDLESIRSEGGKHKRRPPRLDLKKQKLTNDLGKTISKMKTIFKT